MQRVPIVMTKHTEKAYLSMITDLLDRGKYKDDIIIELRLLVGSLTDELKDAQENITLLRAKIECTQMTCNR